MTGPTGAELIVAERVRQRRKWSAAHDDEHVTLALIDVATDLLLDLQDEWGMSKKWPDRIRQLTIRLKRAES